MKQLKVQDRFLAWQDGTPFFYLGDTAWEIFHSLDREELKEYFAVELDIFENSTQTRAIWFDPRTGEEQVFAILPGKGTTHLAPPTQGKGCDWVLILEAVR